MKLNQISTSAGTGHRRRRMAGCPQQPLQRRDARHSSCPVFTLIELLVVVSIIAILAAMLLPVLGQAKEQARRTVCTGNQKQIATMAFMHADDFDDWFPHCNLTHTNRCAWICVWDNDSDPNNDSFVSPWWSGDSERKEENWSSWRNCGTPWKTWQDYGMTDELVMCPSANRVAWTHTDGQMNSYSVYSGKPLYHYGVWGGASGMGDVIGTTYIWVSGLSHATHHVGAYGKRYYDQIKPALKANDPDPHSRLLMMDAVWTDQWPDNTQPRYINHRDPNNPLRPDFQNLVMADGHVERANSYPDMPLPTGDGGAYRPDFAATNTMVFFWEP